MNRKTISLLLILLVVVGVAPLVPKWLPSEEKRIRKRCQSLAKWGTKGKDSGVIALANQVQKLESLFADPCRLDVPAFRRSRDYSPDEITAMLLRFWNEVSHASADFQIHGIEFPDESRAEALTAFSLRGHVIGGEAFAEHHAIIVRLEKTGGDWLFTGFEEVVAEK